MSILGFGLLNPTSSSLSLIGLKPTYISLSLSSLYILTLLHVGVTSNPILVLVILSFPCFLSPTWYQSKKYLRVPATPPPLVSPAAPPPSASAPPSSASATPTAVVWPALRRRRVFVVITPSRLRFVLIAVASSSRRVFVVVTPSRLRFVLVVVASRRRVACPSALLQPCALTSPRLALRRALPLWLDRRPAHRALPLWSSPCPSSLAPLVIALPVAPCYQPSGLTVAPCPLCCVLSSRRALPSCVLLPALCCRLLRLLPACTFCLFCAGCRLSRPAQSLLPAQPVPCCIARLPSPFCHR